MSVDMSERWFEVARREARRPSKGLRPEVAQLALSQAQGLEQAQASRQMDIVRNNLMYDPEFRAPATIDHGVNLDDPVRRNIVATGTDTVTSELLQDNLRVMFATSGGTWGHQRTATKLTAWADGELKTRRFREAWSQVVRDGVISGCGWLYSYIWAGEARCDRLFPANVLIDDAGGADSPPPMIWVRRFVDRHQLMAIAKRMKLGKAALEHIKGMPDASNSIWAIYDDTLDSHVRDRIEVWEGWRVAPYADCDDDETGVHVMVAEGITLVCELYRRTVWPLVCFRPLKPVRGYWGISLVGRVRTLQEGLHDGMKRCEDAMEAGSHSFLIGPPGADDFEKKWTNQVATYVPHPAPERVQVMVAPAMPNQAWEWPDRLRQWALEEFAVNEMQAQGTKPSGLNSGRALRVFVDTGARRYKDLRDSMQLSLCDHMRCLVALRRAQNDNDNGSANDNAIAYRRRGVPITIPWSKVDPDDKHHTVQPFPVGALPTEPAGRIQALQELRADGTITQETYWSMLDFADMQEARDEALAPVEYVRMQLDKMLDEGVEGYEGPWPTHPFERAIELANLTVYKEALRGCPPERLDLVRDYIEECKWMADEQARKATAEAAAQASPAMAGPPMLGDMAESPIPAGVPGMTMPGPGGPVPAGVPGMTVAAA